MTAPVLELRNLVKRFATPDGRTVHAVNDVSLSINPGEIVGLVGESGSGKSTIGLMAARLLEASEGSVLFDGADITHVPEKRLREMRARLQIVFQDPWSALNPRMTIRRSLQEPFLLHTGLQGDARRRAVEQAADLVHLPGASLDRYPHELSGGQLQRVCIARAIALRPKLIVLDEPTSSLDLSVRAGILKLLEELRREIGAAMLFVSHDLETLELVTDRVIVLYLGRIVEQAPTRALFASPTHPYTQALLSAALPPDPDVRLARHMLTGEVPSPLSLPPGCFFAGRCPVAMPACRDAPPMEYERAPGHWARCLRVPDGSFTLPA
ncbi:ABC transporter ATP-binding protein [Humitalea sp. 24SJ18S-53]|uniref:ABC transporter ATP-binding protein n=1 Tax=Humitalea sp. 24SJ18S-53 TaxID=3422307 RepID=UPI003D667D74